MAEGTSESERLAPLFGISILPAARSMQRAESLAQLADFSGLDFLTIQDHPYNGTFLDTWTLFAVLGGKTQRIRLLPNVLNLPLRPPAMLAKAAASLDLLTGGRFELGLGAGAFWEGVTSYGGPQRTPGEALGALKEGMRVMRLLWEPRRQPVNFSGRYYQVHEAQPGPPPAHSIGIWIGGYGPRMLQLIGQQADGWIVSAGYVPPEEIPAKQGIIDAAAQQAGRSQTAIRRAYNLAGAILRPEEARLTARRPGMIIGPVSQWVDTLARYYHELRLDTFIFWAAAPNEEEQVRRFAEEVAPAVKAAIGA